MKKVSVILPTYNEAGNIVGLVQEIIRNIPASWASEILVVDDGSVQNCDRNDFQGGFSVVRAIRTLRLRRNLGHQRSIAIGLAVSSANAVVAARRSVFSDSSMTG